MGNRSSHGRLSRRGSQGLQSSQGLRRSVYGDYSADSLSQSFVQRITQHRIRSLGESARKSRSIRIALSSSFRHLPREWKHFVSVVQPRLIKCARDYGWNVLFVEFDLKSIVQQENALHVLNEDINLPLVFDYYVCVLGGKWSLDEFTFKSFGKDLSQSMTWISDFVGRSYDELEIRLCSLSNNQHVSRVFFYFQNPDLNTFAEESKTMSEEQRNFLRKLKGDIEKSYTPYYFGIPLSLGEKIFSDVQEELESDFSSCQNDNECIVMYDYQEWLAQGKQFFHESRETEVHALIEKLKYDSTREHNPIFVHGPAGVGKSYLLSDVYNSIGEMEGFVCSIFFAGYSKKHDNKNSILEYLYINLCIKLGILKKRASPQPFVETVQRQGFRAFLNLASSERYKAKNICIFIASADQVSSSRDLTLSDDLDWVSETLPENLHLIVSSTFTPNLIPGDRTYSQPTARNKWTPFPVPNMNIVGQYTLIKKHLEVHRSEWASMSSILKSSLRNAGSLAYQVMVDHIKNSIEVECECDLSRLLANQSTADFLHYTLHHFWIAKYGEYAVNTTLSLFAFSRFGLKEYVVKNFVFSSQAGLMSRVNWDRFFPRLCNTFLICIKGKYRIRHPEIERLLRQMFYSYSKERPDLTVLHIEFLDLLHTLSDDDEAMAEAGHGYITWSAYHKLVDFLQNEDVVLYFLSSFRKDFIYLWTELSKHGYDQKSMYRSFITSKGKPSDELINYFREIGEGGYLEYLLEERISKSSSEESKASDYLLMASIREEMGRYEDAAGFLKKNIKCLKKSLNSSLKIMRANHPDSAMTYTHLAGVYSKMKNFEKAQKYYEKSVKLKIKQSGEHSHELAADYEGLSVIMDALGRKYEALQYLEKSLQIILLTFGASHPYVARCYEKLIPLYIYQKRHVKAIECGTEWTSILKAEFGIWHEETAKAYIMIGSASEDSGRNEDALIKYSEALAIQKRLYGEKHADLGTTYFLIANNLEKQRLVQEAHSYFTLACSILSEFRPAHPQTLQAKRGLERTGIS